MTFIAGSNISHVRTGIFFPLFYSCIICVYYAAIFVINCTGVWVCSVGGAMKNVQIKQKTPHCCADGRLTGIAYETVAAGSSIIYLHLTLGCK